MNIQDLQVWEAFLRVAKDRHFGQAARALGIGAPLLTRKIQSLENELGVRLFQRTTRKVGLTEDGRALLPRVEALLQDLENIENQFEAKVELTGVIRIACITALAHRLLGPILAGFSRLHPQVRFEIDANDRKVDLIDSRFDLAIRVEEPSGSDFVYRKLFDNRLVVCASPAYLKQHPKIERPADLRKHAVLTLQAYQECQFHPGGLSVAELLAARKIASESGLLLTELALQGAGVAIRSEWDVRPLIDEGRLVRVLPRYRLDSYGTVYAVMTGNRLLARRVRVFMDYLVTECGSRSRSEA